MANDETHMVICSFAVLLGVATVLSVDIRRLFDVINIDKLPASCYPNWAVVWGRCKLLYALLSNATKIRPQQVGKR